MVCLVSLLAAKNFRVVSFRDFNIEEAKKCTTPRQTLFRYLSLSLFPFLRLCSMFLTRRVSNLVPPCPHDLHLRQSPSIHLHPNIHNLQESNHHSHCLWRSSLVRRLSHRSRTPVLWTHGVEFGSECLGRYQCCVGELCFCAT